MHTRVGDGSNEILGVRVPDEFIAMAIKALERNPGMVAGLGDTGDGSREGVESEGFDDSNKLQTRAIQGVDPDRWRVTNTASNPWRRNGRLSMGCSGGLIGNRVFVTAAHCVWDKDTDAWSPWPIYFSAGQDGTTKPFGDSRVWKRTIPTKYTTCSSNDECRGYDWAVLVLYESARLNVGYFGFSKNHVSPLNIAGYPQSKNRQMWYDNCPIHSDEGKWIKHRCDTEPGTKLSHTLSFVFFFFCSCVTYLHQFFFCPRSRKFCCLW